MKKQTINILIAVISLAVSACTGNEENRTVNPPANLEVSEIGATVASLKWTGDVSAYNLIAFEGGTLIKDTLIFGTLYRLSNLKPGSTYTWKLAAVNYGKKSTYVQGPDFTTQATVAPPSNLTVTNVSETGATFVWQGNTDTYHLTVSRNNKTEIEIDLSDKQFVTNELYVSSLYKWTVSATGGGLQSKTVAGEDFTTKTPAPSTLYFDNVPWLNVEGIFQYHTDFPKPEFDIFLYPNASELYPYVWLMVMTDQPGIYDQMVIFNETGNILINYYQQTRKDWEGMTCGDWMGSPKSPQNITITMINKHYVSGTATAFLFNFKDAVWNAEEGTLTADFTNLKPFTCEFNYIPIDERTKSAIERYLHPASAFQAAYEAGMLPVISRSIQAE